MPRAPEAFRRDPGLGRIDYRQAPTAVYFVAATGDRWRIHDCRMEGGRLVRFPTPGAEAAEYRVFVAATGVKKLYRRTKGELWRLTEAQLDRQLLASEFLPQDGKFNASEWGATE